MTYECLEFEVNEDGVAVMTLNRPDAANAMDLQMSKEMLDVSITCDEDPSVRVLVIRARGRMFCAGGDLKSFAESGDRIGHALKDMTTYLHGAISRFSRMNAPVITEVQGMAAGAGMSLAITGDLVFAGESAGFTMAYTAAGLSPDGSSTFFLPRLVGVQRAKELMITNRRLSAEEALQWGLVNRVIADDALADEVMGAAGTLTGFGTGFGSKRFPGISNILRVTHFDDIPGVAVRTDTIAVCEFEIDDQTAEDLAEALDRIRSRDGVIDITQAPAFGKNGRLSAHVQILANVADLKDTLEAVLVQTATLGVRWRLASRAVLDRTHGTVHIDGETINVKQVTRPDGEITQKAEHRDIATYATSFGARKRLRIAAERALSGGKSFVE